MRSDARWESDCRCPLYVKRIFYDKIIMDCIQFSSLISIICLTESTKKYKI